MFRSITRLIGSLVVTVAVAFCAGRLSAQEIIRLEGRALSTNPEMVEENRPQGPIDKRVAAMTTVGGDTVVTCVAYSPDGKTLAVGDGPNRPICTLGGPPPLNPNGGLIRLIDTKTRRIRDVLGPNKRKDHEYQVDELRFTSDGARLISHEYEYIREGERIDSKERFTVWNLSRRGGTWVVAGRDGIWDGYDVAPDGLTIAVLDRDGTAQIWDAATGTKRMAFRVADDPRCKVARMRFSPDGGSLAFGCGSGEAILKDAAWGRTLASFSRHSREGYEFSLDTLVFSPDGRRLAALGTFRAEDKEQRIPVPTAVAPAVEVPAVGAPAATSEVRLFDVTAGREVARPRIRDGEAFDEMQFTPDGKALFAVGPNTVRVWDAATGEERVSSRRETSWVYRVALSPDGKVAAVGENNAVRLFDVGTGRDRGLLRVSLDGPVRHLAFDPDGQTLASTGLQLRLWDLRAALAPRFDEGHTYDVTSLAYSPDGKALASGSEDRTVKIWDLDRRRPRATLRGHEDEVTSVAYAPDGRTLISGGRDRTVRLWDPRQGKERARLIGHSAPVTSVAVSPDGRMIASGGGADDRTGEVKIWELASGRLVATPMTKSSAVNAVAFSPDGSDLAIGKEDGTVDLWDLAASKVRSLPSADPNDGSSRGVLCLAYSPDGRRLAAGRRDNTIRSWEMARGRETPSATMTHEHFVVALAFSPDGKYLAASDWNETIILWGADTGREMGRFQSPTGWFTSLAFSPDRRSLAGGNRDASISVFAFEGVFRLAR